MFKYNVITIGVGKFVSVCSLFFVFYCVCVLLKEVNEAHYKTKILLHPVLQAWVVGTPSSKRFRLSWCKQTQPISKQFLLEPSGRWTNTKAEVNWIGLVVHFNFNLVHFFVLLQFFIFHKCADYNKTLDKIDVCPVAPIVLSLLFFLKHCPCSLQSVWQHNPFEIML